MSWLLTIFIALILLIIFLHLLGVIQKNDFAKKGVPYAPFNFALVGNMWEIITLRKTYKDYVLDIYNQFSDQMIYGVYQFIDPIIYVRDLELVKQITIKDFEHFHDHHMNVSEKSDRVFGFGLFTMTGQRWKDMRTTLSPVFTSSKMRQMFHLLSECAENSVAYLIHDMNRPENKKIGYLTIEMKDFTTRYANDTIASAVFGLKVDSLKERENHFYEMGRTISNFNGITTIKFFMSTMMPRIMELFKISILNREASDFFFNLVENSMDEREEKNILRPDMIHLLIQAKNGTLKYEAQPNAKDAGFATTEEVAPESASNKRKWEKDRLAAQAILFFFAGFETTSTVLAFLAYELAVNPEIHDKLREEIAGVAERNDGRLRYEDLATMKYMDTVVSETLRKWPPAVAVDRKCTKAYTLPAADDRTRIRHTMKVGDALHIPIYAFHHDPKYFPNPEKFDPERFSDENGQTLNPYAFMPFGIGPRNCIGSRFALMEVKALVYHLLLRFDVVVSPETEIPLKLKRKTFNLQAANGYRVGLRPRGNKDE